MAIMKKLLVWAFQVAWSLEAYNFQYWRLTLYQAQISKHRIHNQFHGPIKLGLLSVHFQEVFLWFILLVYRCILLVKNVRKYFVLVISSRSSSFLNFYCRYFLIINWKLSIRFPGWNDEFSFFSGEYAMVFQKKKTSNLVFWISHKLNPHQFLHMDIDSNSI